MYLNKLLQGFNSSLYYINDKMELNMLINFSYPPYQEDDDYSPEDGRKKKKGKKRKARGEDKKGRKKKKKRKNESEDVSLPMLNSKN